MSRKPDPKPVRLVTTRYALPDGTRCKSSDPGAVKSHSRSLTYYLRLPDGKGGRETVSLGTSDESVAWAEARRFLAERHADALGISSAATRQAARPIADHLADWLAAVAAGDAAAKMVGLLRARVGKLVALAGWTRIGEIRRSTCEVALARLRAEPTARTGVDAAGAARGRSAQTSNHYLGHARQFTRWLVREGRLPSDPLAGARGVRTGEDRRHDRRSPSDEEVRVFFDHLYGRLGTPRDRSGMGGGRRALGYAVCMCSGFRAGELRSLRESSFDLDSGNIRLRAGADKRRRRAVQALPRWLCDDLRAWFGGGGGTWEPFPAAWPGRLLQADLGAAREAWIRAGGTREEEQRRVTSAVCVYEVATEDGPLFWDFHSLRHWYVSRIAGTAGISPSTMSALVRHSDARLTMEVYAKAQADRVREAVDGVRPPGAGRDAPGG